MKTTRKIIEIDEERCNGCGLCVLDCAEGAIAIVDGKAKVVSDSFCDGLGACLGSCPQDALHIIEREAVPFDEEAALEHVRKRDSGNMHHGQAAHGAELSGNMVVRGTGHGGCPGAALRSFGKDVPVFAVSADAASGTSACSGAGSSAGPGAGSEAGFRPVTGPGHWPLKIRLVPPTAPFLKGADVLVAADCAAAASPFFHSHFARGKVVLIGCPKFDDTEAYTIRLAEILADSGIASLTVLRMEVPCCRGLSAAVEKARTLSGTKIPIREVVMTRAGGEAVPGPLLA